MQTSEVVDLIKKAIHDCEVTNAEFQEIMTLVDADGMVDSGEQKLLSELQNLIANGTVKRVAG